MASRAEQVLSRALWSALADLPDGAAVPDSEPYRDALTALEYYIPEVLGELHREWRFGGLDGVIPVVARKAGTGEVELLGLCVLMADQTLTPLHLRLRVSPIGDAVAWLECRLGEVGAGGMVQTPYRALRAASKRLAVLTGGADAIDWVYAVTFGERRS